MGKYAEQRSEERNYKVTPEQSEWLQAKFGTGREVIILDLAAEFAKEFNVELHLAETKVGLWIKVKTGKSTL